jgi:hypothetical protein
MRLLRILAVFAGLMLPFAGYLAVHADGWDKTTKVTFSEPVQVPGKVLPAGTYVFKLADSSSDRHIVQIFTEDHMRLITTVLAIPNYRLQPADKTILTYDERPADQPMALDAWFYPGDNFGQEFVYPKSRASELSRLNKREVPSTGSEEAYPGISETQSTATTDKNVAPSESKPEALAPRIETTPSPAPNPEPAQTNPEPQRQLPHTASLLPLVGLVGFTLIAVAALLRFALRA